MGGSFYLNTLDSDVSSRQSDRLMSRQSALLKKQEEVQLDVAQMNVARYVHCTGEHMHTMHRADESIVPAP